MLWRTNDLCCFPHLESALLSRYAVPPNIVLLREIFQSSVEVELTASQNGSRDHVKSCTGDVRPGLPFCAEISNKSNSHMVI